MKLGSCLNYTLDQSLLERKSTKPETFAMSHCWPTIIQMDLLSLRQYQGEAHLLCALN